MRTLLGTELNFRLRARESNMNYSVIAKDILDSNIYMTLATSSNTGRPWAAPVYYCFDKKFNFYFISQLSSRHIRHILNNPTIAFAIYDSHQKEGVGNGVQGIGKARLLHDREIPEALKWYKTSFVESKLESFTGKAPYRLFKIVAKHLYILDPLAKVDKRIEVKL